MVLGHPVILYGQFWDLSIIIHFLANQGPTNDLGWSIRFG